MANRIHTVEPEIISKTVKALLAYNTKKSANEDVGKALFQEAEKVILQIDLHQVPKLHNKTFSFELPKSPAFDKETSEVCAIVKDDMSMEKYEHRGDLRILFKKACPFVTEVIPVRVLKADVRTHEQKRILANSYDFFVADRQVFDVIPKHLGSQFTRNKKMPSKINHLSADGPYADSLQDKLVRVLSQGSWCLDGRGTCSSITIGTTDFTEEEITVNVKAAIQAVADNVPRGWSFVRSIHAKLENSIALEMYRANTEDKAPKEQDPLEAHHEKRTNLNESDLVSMYKSLQRNNKKRPSKKSSKAPPTKTSKSPKKAKLEKPKAAAVEAS